MSQELTVCVHEKRSTWMLSTDAGCQTKALLVKHSVRGHVSSLWHFSLQHMGLSPCPTLFTVVGWLGLYVVLFFQPFFSTFCGQVPLPVKSSRGQYLSPSIRAMFSALGKVQQTFPNQDLRE